MYVRPASGYTCAPLFLAASLNALIKEDLPLFGRPTTITMLISDAARSRCSQPSAACNTWSTACAATTTQHSAQRTKICKPQLQTQLR